MAQLTMDTLATPRRRASDEMIAASDLGPDEIACPPGSRSWSLSTTGHEHQPDERGVVTCRVCYEALKYEKAVGSSPGRISATFELSAEQGLTFRRLLSAAGVDATEWLRRQVIDTIAAETRRVVAPPPERRR